MAVSGTEEDVREVVVAKEIRQEMLKAGTINPYNFGFTGTVAMAIP